MIPTNENFGLDKLRYLKFDILNLPIRKKTIKNIPHAVKIIF